MGYSARYHVASLAAIFLALGVGILIGTGLGKNVINGTTRRLESSLKSDLDSARSQAATLRTELHQQQDFAQGVYPALTDNALRRERIAVVALGSLDGTLRGDIERVLGPQNATGARIREFAVIREPLDGLERTGVPVVAVERTDTDPSSISLFRAHGLATVDNLDQTAGGVALVYALRGANGSYGVGPNANRLLPALGRVRRATAL